MQVLMNFQVTQTRNKSFNELNGVFLNPCWEWNQLSANENYMAYIMLPSLIDQLYYPQQKGSIIWSKSPAPRAQPLHLKAPKM